AGDDAIRVGARGEQRGLTDRVLRAYAAELVAHLLGEPDVTVRTDRDPRGEATHGRHRDLRDRAVLVAAADVVGDDLGEPRQALRPDRHTRDGGVRRR